MKVRAGVPGSKKSYTSNQLFGSEAESGRNLGLEVEARRLV